VTTTTTTAFAHAPSISAHPMDQPFTVPPPNSLSLTTERMVDGLARPLSSDPWIISSYTSSTGSSIPRDSPRLV